MPPARSLTANGRRYMAKRAQGLCGQCGRNKPVGNRAICEPCNDRNKVKHNEWRRKKINKGLCTRCGQRPICTESAVACRECFRRRSRSHQKAREQIIERHGTICACCGIDDRRFLTVDHKNNDGPLDRSRFGDVYARILRGEQTNIQILCWNCNMAKGIFRGTCPHKILITGDDWIVRAA